VYITAFIIPRDTGAGDSTLFKVIKNNMKRLVIVAIVLVGLFGGTYLLPSKTEVINPAPEVVEKEVTVDALEQAIKTAQDTAQTDITAKAQKAYDDAYAQEMKTVELQVIKDFNVKLDARQIELEKETQVY